MTYIMVNGVEANVSADSIKTGIKRKRSSSASGGAIGSSSEYSTIKFSTKVADYATSAALEAVLTGQFHCIRLSDMVSSTGIKINMPNKLKVTHLISDSNGVAGCVDMPSSATGNGMFSIDFNLKSNWTVLIEHSLDGSSWTKSAFTSNNTTFTNGLAGAVSDILCRKGSFSSLAVVNMSSASVFISRCVVFYKSVLPDSILASMTAPSVSMGDIMSKTPNVKISINGSEYVNSVTTSIAYKFKPSVINGVFDGMASLLDVSMEEV